jgi:hypothetical protein
MTDKDIQAAGLESLIDRCCIAARQHGETTERGDWATANAAAGLIAAIYAELRRRGLDAQRQLLRLLFDPSPGVSGWAGAHALEFAPSEGVAALTRLAALPGLAGLSAETTLKEWRNGCLRFREADEGHVLVMPKRTSASHHL